MKDYSPIWQWPMIFIGTTLFLLFAIVIILPLSILVTLIAKAVE